MKSIILKILGRDREFFDSDIRQNKQILNKLVSSSRFLILGAAGSIGQAVAKEVFSRSPKKLHLVDISENNLVEAVRDVRSSLGYFDGEFKTFALDIGSDIYDAFIRADGHYDYVLNLSALKHVRSEKDPFTLMRMIDVNVINTDKTILQSIELGVSKYFCVSTDKAANPVNMMGASKRIMELFLSRRANDIPISTARFANVAFSDGSLLHGFNQRMNKRQPIAAPTDVKRYFVTPKESGELCLMSCLLGDKLDIFYPKLSENLQLTPFSDIAVRFLESRGYEPYACSSEDEARERVEELSALGKWPCYFFTSDTTGEKDYEEFFTNKETVDLNRFENIGIIKNCGNSDIESLDYFSEEIRRMRTTGSWTRLDLISLFNRMIPEFDHKETGKFLDEKM
jgi:UDP-N-acetylglucosamine 4,6-dehydratase